MEPHRKVYFSKQSLLSSKPQIKTNSWRTLWYCENVGEEVWLEKHVHFRQTTLLTHVLKAKKRERNRQADWQAGKQRKKWSQFTIHLDCNSNKWPTFLTTQEKRILVKPSLDFKEFIADTKSAVLLFSLVCNHTKETEDKQLIFEAHVAYTKANEQSSAILGPTTSGHVHIVIYTPFWPKGHS